MIENKMAEQSVAHVCGHGEYKATCVRCLLDSVAGLIQLFAYSCHKDNCQSQQLLQNLYNTKVLQLERELAEARKQIEMMRPKSCHNCVMLEMSNTETCMECMWNPLYARSVDNWRTR